MPEPAPAPDRDEWVVSVVAAAFEGAGFYPGRGEWGIVNDCYATARTIRDRFEHRSRVPTAELPHPLSQITPARLRSLARRGLIAARQVESYGTTEWKFSTVELDAACRAEIAMSDAERAERTAASVAAAYERNLHHYGDKVAHWPVDASLNAVVSDGIAAAVDAGLIVAVDGALGRRYVPAERFEAYAETLDDARRRDTELDQRAAVLAERLFAHAGGGRLRYRAVELDMAHVARLVELLDQAQPA